ncbi:hypothetical protein JOC55_005782 [Paenibacillus sacheonensis]|nr:hypothetical protein [Paenibacillus sacheonensis]
MNHWAFHLTWRASHYVFLHESFGFAMGALVVLRTKVAPIRNACAAG